MSEKLSEVVMPSPSVDQLCRDRRAGFALDAGFYRSPAVFARDLERVFMKVWMYAGHVSEIPDQGSYFLHEIAGESVIITRDSPDGGEGNHGIRALVNVCRHRGSRICLEHHGRVKTFVCKYHGWTYGLDGGLRSKRHMPDEFDRSQYGLHQIHLQVIEGMIFVSFAAEPPDLTAATVHLRACLAPYQLSAIKVAAKRRYPVAANWKLAVENFMECYHCAPAHPEYSRIHTRKALQDEEPALWQAWRERAPAAGLTTESISQVGVDADTPGLDLFYDRHPLYPGYVTGSEDGEPLAPLLGSLTEYDGGATDIGIGCLSFGLLYSDHVVIYRFIPITTEETDMEIVWLVNETAEDGVDYDVERLVWLWDVTSVADKRIINNNQAGVNSRYYAPGPYSQMETYAEAFATWYVSTIAG